MKIKIKEPCDADWSKMKIGIQSRHCELCVKNVMDFTQMTRQEIIEYLFNNQNKSTCGRMLGGQIDFRIADFEAVIKANRRKKGNQPFLVLSFASLAMMSCDNQITTDDFDPVVGELIEFPIDTNSHLEQPKVTVKCTPKEIKPPLPIEINQIAGGIEIETGEMVMHVEPEIMGDVMPEEHLTGKIMRNLESLVLDVAEKMPEYPEGMEALMVFLESEIKYPKKAIKKEVEGKVYVSFVVETDGSINQAKVLRGIGEGCDEEALRVVNKMPNWIPGENKGEKVRVKFTLPISFVLK